MLTYRGSVALGALAGLWAAGTGDPAVPLLESIANVGFPIVVASYLLVRVEAKLDRLAVAITELTAAIRRPGTDDGKT